MAFFNEKDQITLIFKIDYQFFFKLNFSEIKIFPLQNTNSNSLLIDKTFFFLSNSKYLSWDYLGISKKCKILYYPIFEI